MDEMSIAKDSISQDRLESLAYLYNCRIIGSDEYYYILEGADTDLMEFNVALAKETKEWEMPYAHH